MKDIITNIDMYVKEKYIEHLSRVNLFIARAGSTTNIEN